MSTRSLIAMGVLLLAVAALRDRKTGEAKMLLAGLSKEFPRNRLYAEELARLR